jgi:hypothetical protein
MFFFLRCIFWLSIVYATIFWPKDFDPKAAVEILPKARQLAGEAVGQARDEIARSCINAPAVCLEAYGFLNLPASTARAGGKTRASPRETAAPP